VVDGGSNFYLRKSSSSVIDVVSKEYV